MKFRFPLSGLFGICIVLLLTSNVYSQDDYLVDEATAGNFFVVGARALGMGGAYIAVANDATSLVYNPAGLARVTRIEFSGGLTHQRMGNKTRWDLLSQHNGSFQNNTRFSSANVVLPVPTYRGSLVFALGVNRVKSFDKIMQFRDDGSIDGFEERGIESQSGGLYLWSFGAAIDVSPNVSVGGALNLWTGKDNYTWLYERNAPTHMVRYDDAIKDRYSGLNAKFGFRIQPNKYFVLGGTVQSPVTYTIEEDWTQLTETDTGSEYDYGSSEYKVSLPFSFGTGFAFNLNDLTLAGEVDYTDWTQMEYKRLEDLAEANRQIKDTYTDALRIHLGIEYRIPQIGTSLRAGFYRDPLPYKSRLIEKDRSVFTGGIGFLIDQVMTLDLAWAHGSYELKDFTPNLLEEYTFDRIFVSIAYRL